MKSKLLLVNLIFVVFLLFGCKGKEICHSPTYTIEENVDSSTEVFDFRFEIKSVGIFKVLKIEKTCGCTTVNLDKWAYKPNDVGILSGKINLNNTLGKQEIKITVFTDSKDFPTITYTVRLYIPKLITLTPGLLFWKTNTANVSKSADIELFDSASLVSVKSLSKDFQCKVMQNKCNDSKYVITVTPINTIKFMRGKIAITVRKKDNKEKIYNLHLLIR